VERAAVEDPVDRAVDRPSAVEVARASRVITVSESTCSTLIRRSGVWIRSRCAPADA
jgi:hypothetical protein